MYQVPSEEFLRQNQIKQNKQGKKYGMILMVGSVLITLILGFFAYRSFEKYSWSETTGTVTYTDLYKGSLNSNDARS
jgi:hypothetical protein